MTTDFTIVIPAFNKVDLLKRALESTVQQTGVSFDIVVADDSTTNDVEQFIGQWKSDIPITYLHNRPTMGAVPNWNNALKAATGRYIILMHHDEAMQDPHHLLTIAGHMNQGADIVISAVTVYAGGKERRRLFPSSLTNFFIHHPTLLFLANPIGPCACVAFRKEHVQPFDDRLQWLVDVEWYYRMLRGRKAVFDKSLHIVSIHGHDGQITGNIDTTKVFVADKKILFQTYSQVPLVRFMLALQHTCIVWPKSIIKKIRGKKI
ncbi:MAG: glycosyltransferase [Prevotella sp.]|nr:glycosyltransferase [Prevotella sp.]